MTTRQAQTQAHLPPRCPIQKKPINGSIPNHEYSSRPFMEDHPAWLDDLLSDPESNSKGSSLRRSVSDSVTLLDSVADSFSILGHHYDEGSSVGNPTSSGLESASSMYGPNSPRLRSSSSFSENAIVSALSEYVSQESGQYIDGGLGVSGVGLSDMKMEGELNAEAKAAKRHPGQRSRIRKLQYIAELERTVDVLQTLESNLAIRVASLLQQRVALSVENNKLKQQLARLQKEKLMVDGQYQLLKKEVKRLKTGLPTSTHSKIRTCYVPNPPAEAGSLEAMQMTLDMEKLNFY
ncbi:Basic-leucine zipper transcription factor [Trema orientale]|uniref:Basic-leucine zipper transcription factor n=1 Tax=Trema orientale TaxID=63057 RepID=A0A2P5EFR5_TREOI|nr:Basic-leucine zipper transcription factor [Trema orientale]